MARVTYFGHNGKKSRASAIIPPGLQVAGPVLISRPALDERKDAGIVTARKLMSIFALAMAMAWAMSVPAAAAFPLPAVDGPPARAGCPRADRPPVIDGRLDDAAWTRWLRLDNDIEGDAKPRPRLGTDVATAWDDSFFYVAARLAEPHVWATYDRRDAVIYHENDFEVFLDPDGDNHLYYELEINALGTVWDLLLVRPYRDGGPAVDAWDIAGLRAAVHVDGTLNDPSDRDEGWSLELAFPWTVLAQAAGRPAPPAPGDVWRVNFSRVQWRTEPAPGGGYAKIKDPATGAPLPEDNWVWSPQGLVAMHYPERWGELVFLAAGQDERDAFAGNPEHDAILLAGALMPVYYRQREFHAAHGRYAADPAELGLDAGTLPLREPGRVLPLGPGQVFTLAGGPDWFLARLVTPLVTATVDHEGRLRRFAP